MDHPGRLSLLVTSPRVGPGLLSHQAWQALEAADTVCCRNLDEPGVAAILDAGVAVAVRPETSATELARALVREAGSSHLLWVGSIDADPGLSEAVAHEVTSGPDAPEVEVLIGSWDVPGARLLDAVAVMDRLRSPGGCPWDAEQSHESLTPYLLEETYECVEALESGDREHMIEELGDVLLQVLFHARVAQTDSAGPDGDCEDRSAFDVDDVAAMLVQKLIRRHPHVFAGDAAGTPREVQASWDQLKAAEKPGRAHLLDGIPAGMPDLARAAKVTARLIRAGHEQWLVDRIEATAAGGAQERWAAQVLELVRQARAQGIDPGVALRAALRAIESQSPAEPA